MRSNPLLFVCMRNVMALAGVAHWIAWHPVNQGGRWFDFPSRAQAWVAGWVPSVGHMRGNHTLMFLSLSFSPSLSPSLLLSNTKKINKILKKRNVISEWSTQNSLIVCPYVNYYKHNTSMLAYRNLKIKTCYPYFYWKQSLGQHLDHWYSFFLNFYCYSITVVCL